MNITRAHFELIAAVLRELGATSLRFDSPDDRKRIAEVFADRFASANPRFDRSRFIRAIVPTKG